jgi:hypothetical protein
MAKMAYLFFNNFRLPTYFHDNFPEAKSWIFNIVPWILMIPGTIAGGYLSQRLLAKGYSVGSTRKILESICMVTEMICLIVIGKKVDYHYGFYIFLFFTSFHFLYLHQFSLSVLLLLI